MAKKAKAKNWIKGAIKKPGALAASAKKAGKTTAAFAKDKAKAPGKLGKRARLALVFAKFRKGKKKK
jgi:hypothetical protein